MATNYTHVPRYTHLFAAANASASVDIGANLLLVPDVTNGTVRGMPAVQVPTTASTPKLFAGVCPAKIPFGKTGDIAKSKGDIVMLIADGAISKGDKLTISTTSTKEGFAKASTTVDVLFVGFALEAASGDGVAFYAELDPKMSDA